MLGIISISIAVTYYRYIVIRDFEVINISSSN